MSVTLADKTSRIKAIVDALPKDQAKPSKGHYQAFIEALTHMVATDVLMATALADQAGCFASVWAHFQRFKGKKPLIKIFNPDYAADGWQSSHTCILVIAPDMPFVVDSLKIALDSNSWQVQNMTSSIFGVKRTSGKLVDLKTELNSSAKGFNNELFLLLEVSRIEPAVAHRAMESRLHGVLDEVGCVLKGFKPMKQQVQTLIKEIKACAKYVEDDAEETLAFLQWLADDHFSFLGYNEFQVKGVRSPKLVRDKSKDLGVCQYDYNKVAPDMDDEDVPQHIVKNVVRPTYLSFSKGFVRSRIHRSVYPDFIGVRLFDSKGRVTRVCRFVGLLTANVYNSQAGSIPVLRKKFRGLYDSSGLSHLSHYYRNLGQVIDTLPRDELFQASQEQLLECVLGILSLQDRQETKLFIRKDDYSRFWSCIVFMPRDAFSTSIRERIQRLLEKRLNAKGSDFYTYLSDSPLARAHFILTVDPSDQIDFDVQELEDSIREITSSWNDELDRALIERFAEDEAFELNVQYGKSFSASYKESYLPRTAALDISNFEALQRSKQLELMFYTPPFGSSDTHLHLKIYHLGGPLELSEVVPVIENMGVRVLEELSFTLVTKAGVKMNVQDFLLHHPQASELNLNDLNASFSEAFRRVWKGDMDDGRFNQLIVGAGFTWRQVTLIRAYSHYLNQIRFGFSQRYIARCLSDYVEITQGLVKLFETRFNPSAAVSMEERQANEEALTALILSQLDEVSSLDDDRILRQILACIQGTLRTNYYQRDDEGNAKPTFVIKLSPIDIPNVPKPAPQFEMFVFSPDVEGVHLRGGKVARGGLRWSDRYEDYRTEVLGLVKAQQVKNSVIVPVGAKGGFVVKNLPAPSDRDAFMEAGVAGYKKFISSLLDVTDNLIEGQVVPPKQVVRHDEDDPYLVVAADKGTATFSDIANQIAEERGHWLGDAFASGGSNGYDHKGMGITARGAWVSVQRHFRERDINVQTDTITVLGIGDMAGDVFGNGMLLSEKIALVGAFNHLHIFVDPNPNVLEAFKERKRLFETPRTTWAHYGPELISAGGGVFERSAKRIPISSEMKARFSINEEHLTPNELINAMLKAPIDLLWNGGIGTYLKGSKESHDQVGDKANDAIRIDASQAQFSVLGEGGNLGATQLGRIEYGLTSGQSYTDFIDNSAGVDCSDHEVNIKILLGQIIEAGDLTAKQRNELLVDMTDQVADGVLMNNYRQTQAIGIAYSDAHNRIEEYRRFMLSLEEDGKLDRLIEFLPNDNTLKTRVKKELGLTRPEISTLISYSKNDLKERLLTTDLADDEHVSQCMLGAFPPMLVEKYQPELLQHPLKAEIVATQLANDIVNRMGITFVRRLEHDTGHDLGRIIRAYVVVKEALGIEALWKSIEALDYQLPDSIQVDMLVELMKLMRRSVRWLLRNQHGELNVSSEVDRFALQGKSFKASIVEELSEAGRASWESRTKAFVGQGVPEALAENIAAARFMYNQFCVVDICQYVDRSPTLASASYMGLYSSLELGSFTELVSQISTSSFWNSRARDGFLDNLDQAIRTIVINALRASPHDNAEQVIEDWKADKAHAISRWKTLLYDMKKADKPPLAMYSVALSELGDLASRA